MLGTEYDTEITDVSFVRNSEGRTALRVAVIKGRVRVVSELIRVKCQLARVLTDERGSSALHLCVKKC